MITLATFSWIVGGLLGVVITLFGFTIKYILKDKETRIEELSKKIDKQELELNKIKTNYLDRFERVNKNISETKEEIVEVLHTLSLELAKISTKINNED